MYQFDVYSLNIFGGGCAGGALHFSLDHILNWCRDDEERDSVMRALNTPDRVLQYDYTCGGNRRWHEFSVS